jgi:cytochrome bd-type quinol oxidase subunit 1
MRDGIAYPVSWFEIVFNPSFPYRFTHMLVAAYLTTSLVVLAVGARYLVAGRFVEEGKTMARMGVGMLAVLAPLQLVIGDFHGLNTAKHQPAKVAAMEAHWDGSKPGDLVLFAWPDAEAERNRFEVSIPKGASLIITHDPDGLFPGLKDFAPEDRPPVWPVFFSFRIMVAIGLAMIAIGFVGAWLWWRGRLFETRQSIIDAVADSEFLELTPPAGAMYAFPRVSRERLPDFDDQRFAYELLEQRHVLVAPGVSFNVPYTDHFRITTLPEPAVMREVFTRMEELLYSWAVAEA